MARSGLRMQRGCKRSSPKSAEYRMIELISSWNDLMVPREGIIRNHRRDEPLFVLSMVARVLARWRRFATSRNPPSPCFVIGGQPSSQGCILWPAGSRRLFEPLARFTFNHLKLLFQAVA